MKKSNEPAKRVDSLDFELPDWSGMDDSVQRISIEAAFALASQNPAFVSEETIRKWREQRPPKCEVEFVF